MAKKNLYAFLLTVFLIRMPSSISRASAADPPALQLNRGFKASFDPTGDSFQSLLSDPTGTFSLGFIEINSSSLDLAIIHVASDQPVWRAIPAQPARRSGSVSVSFNGSLLFSDQQTGILLWSTLTPSGDRAVLLNSSNLLILKISEPIAVLWKSFDFPSDTIVQNQNFTSSAALLSANQRFSMKLGSTFLALSMEFGKGLQEPMYWKRTASEAKNQIMKSEGPIYAQVSALGFLGLYQRENVAVDIIPFDSFGRGINGFRRLTLEEDGNLRGYNWNGSIWAPDYEAISKICELPSACGAYGVCSGAGEPHCSCVDGCFESDSGNLCSDGKDDFLVVRRKGVDLANKELLGFVKVQTLEDCEGLCERNCSCWGAIYNNASGYCYGIFYPIQTITGVGDDGRVGYFKIRNTGNGESGGDKGKRKKTTTAVLVVVCVLVAIFGAGAAVYRLRRSRRRRRRSEGALGTMMAADGLAPSSYKDLQSMELSDSFRKP